MSFFARRPRAGCASGKILRFDLPDLPETDVIDTTGLTIGRNRRVADRGENERDVGQFEREEEVFGVSGAALVARREALEDVTVAGECLDESFHMYKEDVDLSWRLRLAGWECWYVPSAVAYHGRTIHGTSRRSYLADVRLFRENERSKPVSVRMNSMKNQWVLLLKNDDLANFCGTPHGCSGARHSYSVTTSCLLRHDERPRAFCTKRSRGAQQAAGDEETTGGLARGGA